MKTFYLLLMAVLILPELHADVIEFFNGGDFQTRCEYGSGNNAFSTDRNMVVSWNQKAGTMNFSLKEKSTIGIASVRMHRTCTHHAGLEFTVKARMRGKGRVRFEVGEKSTPIQLTEKWQDYTVKVPGSPSERLTMVIWLSGAGSAMEMDNLSVTVINQDTLILPPSPGALLVTPGAKVPEQKFTVYPNDVRGKFIHYTSSDRKTSTLSADSLLHQVVYPEFTAGQQGYHRIIYTTGNCSASRDIVIATQPEIDALTEAAKAIDLQNKPMRMLYLGDSLTDFDRGFNHASVAAGVLDQCYPGQITMRNGAIGGDEVRRIDNRLARRSTYRGYIYDAMWDEKYDVIFISLGQNDTVSNSKTNFTQPQIPIAEVDQRMRNIVKFIKARSSARIVLVSAVMTPENTNPNYHFGVPALVNAYNQCIQKIASDNNIEYCDLYTPFAAMSNQERLAYFVADKVHLSPLGHRFAALQILKHLSRNK